MQIRIELLNEKKLIGQRLIMSFSENKTTELWGKFMPKREKIQNNLTTDLISMQIYDPLFFSDFDLHKKFEKWAAVEVSDLNNIPKGMESYILISGLYAVFNYKGSSTDNSIFNYIFEVWLPQSNYMLDNRPHFEILGNKYKNDKQDSEEEIWIPIKNKNTAYLLLGSNQGDRIKILEHARLSIEKFIGKIIKSSQLYESEAWGFVSNNFINQVVCVETILKPQEVLDKIHEIEFDAGRVRKSSNEYEARPLDIDILFYNDEIIKTEGLIIPHPRLHERTFTLIPLTEIAAKFIHPTLSLTIQQLLENSTDKSKVWIYE